MDTPHRVSMFVSLNFSLISRSIMTTTPPPSSQRVKLSNSSAVGFLIWALLVAPLDNILKPLLLGRGVDVPILVIFVGAIGGFLNAGIIGLFLGAVVLALGYKLFLAWLAQDSTADTDPERDEPVQRA